jgi:hypothetical protein
MGLPSYFFPTIEQVQEAREQMIGFCRLCGTEREETEPDAEHYDCSECLANEVFGAEEYVIRGWIKE